MPLGPELNGLSADRILVAPVNMVPIGAPKAVVSRKERRAQTRARFNRAVS